MLNNIKIAIGPCGSGKSTRFIEDLAATTHHKIWVLEPTRRIVEVKTKGLSHKNNTNYNIEYINYAKGFSTQFYLDKQKENDFFIVDEAQQIFFAEFRQFDVKNLHEIISLYGDRLTFISATPKILEIYLGLHNATYATKEYPQRLKRNAIKINIIPTTYNKFVNKDTLDKYDIILSNNIKNVKKTELLVNDYDNYSFIYSYFAESNNLLFDKRPIKERNNNWVGTCAMSSGVDKFTVMNKLKSSGHVLFDAVGFMQLPDVLKSKYKEATVNPLNPNFKTKKQRDDYFETIFLCLTENVIQSDRFRIDLNMLEIDLLVDIELDKCARLSDVLIKYYKEVYKDTIDVSTTIGNGLYANKLTNFNFDLVNQRIQIYNPNHTDNDKPKRQRFHELLDDWCNPIQNGDKRDKRLGNYKSTLKYFEAFYKKFWIEKDKDFLFFENDLDRKRRSLYVHKGISNFSKYLFDNQLKEKIHAYLLTKEVDITKKKIPVDDELYLDLAYVGESLLQILFANYDVKYNLQDSEKKRSGSPMQLLPKYLRALLIVKDIDVCGCHIVALIKKLLGDDIEVTKDKIESLYSYKAMDRDSVLTYLQSSYKGHSVDAIEKALGGERGSCKQAIISAINKEKHRNKKDFEYVKKVLTYTYPSIANIDIMSVGKIGYWNGIVYEHKWLESYNMHRGIIFRIADGLCQIYGYTQDELSILKDIKETIIKDHKIAMSDEDILKYKKLDLNKTLNDFIMEAYEDYKDVMITDDMIIKSFSECVESLEKFRKYIRKGKTKGKAKGKKINMKKYLVMQDFVIKKTGAEYKKGVHDWPNIPKEITKFYRTKYLDRIA